MNLIDDVNLDLAVFTGDERTVREFLSNPDFDPSVDDNRLIRIAASSGLSTRWSSISSNVNIVRLLLQNTKVDPSANNNEAIQTAAKFGDDMVVYLLMQDPRVDPSANNNEAIRNALENNHMKCVKALLCSLRVRFSFLIEKPELTLLLKEIMDEYIRSLEFEFVDHDPFIDEPTSVRIQLFNYAKSKLK